MMNFAAPAFFSALSTFATSFFSCAMLRCMPACCAKGENSSHSLIFCATPVSSSRRMSSPTNWFDAICWSSSTALNGPWSMRSLFTT